MKVGQSAWTGRIYLPIGVLMLVIAVVGFWPTYFSHLSAGTLDKSPVIHLHSVIFSGWLLLVITQAVLAGRGRIALHRRVGRAGMAYGVVVVVVGWLTAFSQFAMRVETGNMAEATRRLFAPFTDMLVFGPVLWAAWHYRDKPEIHKRLIVTGTAILLVAAVHRMTFLGGPPPPTPLLLAIWLSPIALGVAHDAVTRRLIHPVYPIGVVLILLMKFRAPLRETEAWQGFTAWLATRLAGG